MFCNDQRNQTKKKVAVAKVAHTKKRKKRGKRGLLNPQKKKEEEKKGNKMAITTMSTVKRWPTKTFGNLHQIII